MNEATTTLTRAGRYVCPVYFTACTRDVRDINLPLQLGICRMRVNEFTVTFTSQLSRRS